MKPLLAILAAAAVAVPLHGTAVSPPRPYGPLPTMREMRGVMLSPHVGLQALELYGFMHFTVNTFTDKEWGYGDEKESVFNPTDFDAMQIVRAFKAGGLRGLILTCKHHDGFCLWPSKFTEHSVKNSPWRGGKGDMVREIVDACRTEGLSFGVYLSPWDRNHKDYGTPAYITYYRNQLRELLTNYGPLFSVWFDGANGGDGFYGGARERRNIERTKYYDWPGTWALVRKLQPGAVIFSDAGPDIRWVGNENGIAGDPCWATYTPRAPDGTIPAPGFTVYKEGVNGHRDGKFWMPAEVDFSIRPGWFHHPAEDDKVRTPEDLFDHYFLSVGHGATMNLNVPPDRRGQIHQNDVRSLEGFGKLLEDTFSRDLALNAKISASNVRGGDTTAFGPWKLLDNNRETYWATDDAIVTPEVVLDFAQPVTFNIVRLREAIRLGQRVDDWELDEWRDGVWREFAKGTAIGACRLVRGKPVTTTKVRLRITRSPVCPAIAEFGLFREPAARAAGK
jgi:alpha-L-fucosidase